MVSYDPDEKPQLTNEMRQLEEDGKGHIAQFICFDQKPEIKPGGGYYVPEEGCVTFLSVVPFLPRPEDEIKLLDKKHTVKVWKVFWSQISLEGSLYLMPCVECYKYKITPKD